MGKITRLSAAARREMISSCGAARRAAARRAADSRRIPRWWFPPGPSSSSLRSMSKYCTIFSDHSRKPAAIFVRHPQHAADDMAGHMGGEIFHKIDLAFGQASCSRPVDTSLRASAIQPSMTAGENSRSTSLRSRSCTVPSLSSRLNCTKREWSGMSCQLAARFCPAMASGGRIAVQGAHQLGIQRRRRHIGEARQQPDIERGEIMRPRFGPQHRVGGIGIARKLRG